MGYGWFFKTTPKGKAMGKNAKSAEVNIKARKVMHAQETEMSSLMNAKSQAGSSGEMATRYYDVQLKQLQMTQRSTLSTQIVSWLESAIAGLSAKLVGKITPALKDPASTFNTQRGAFYKNNLKPNITMEQVQENIKAMDGNIKKFINEKAADMPVAERDALGNALRDQMYRGEIPGKNPSANPNKSMNTWGDAADSAEFTHVDPATGILQIKGVWGEAGAVSRMQKTLTAAQGVKLKKIQKQPPGPEMMKEFEALYDEIGQLKADAAKVRETLANERGTPLEKATLGDRLAACAKVVWMIGNAGIMAVLLYVMMSFIQRNTGCMMVELDTSPSAATSSQFTKLKCITASGGSDYWSSGIMGLEPGAGVCANIGELKDKNLSTTIIKGSDQGEICTSEPELLRPECHGSPNGTCPGNLKWHGADKSGTKNVSYTIISVGDFIGNVTTRLLDDAEKLAGGGMNFLEELLKWLPLIVPILVLLVVFGLLKGVFHAASGSPHSHFNFNTKRKKLKNW